MDKKAGDAVLLQILYTKDGDKKLAENLHFQLSTAPDCASELIRALLF